MPLEEVSSDETFRLRETGDVAELATAIGRLGQLTPVDLRPLPGAGEGKRWQIVSGFRRVEALRLLQRERVLCRVHATLDDTDAWALALAGPLFGRPWTPADLAAIAPIVKERLPWASGKAPASAPAGRAPGAKGAAAAAAASPVSSAASASPAASGTAPPADVPASTPGAHVHALAVRAHQLGAELAIAQRSWSALPPEGRRMVLEQLRYLVRLFPFLEKETP